MNFNNKINRYKVSYLAGIINTQEYSIEIESIVDLTEQYIKDEIEKQRPNHKGQIMAVFNPLNIGEKSIVNGIDDILKRNNL